MTDKQIIIDGVDVSRCSYHYKHTRVCLVKMDAAGRYYNCANWHDCDFKKLSQQLKAKEQECEALGQAYLETNELLQEKTKECTNLKAENEELKNFHINLVGVKECEIKELLKLKQTLTEIKEIAQYDVYTSRTDLCLKLNWVKKKISEFEVEDELHSPLL